MENKDQDKYLSNLKFNTDTVPNDYKLLFQKLKIIKEIINF